MSQTFDRRAFLAGSAVFCLLSAAPSFAEDAAPADTQARSIEEYYATLLGTMKKAKELGIKGRYAQLEPAIKRTFDLAAMTRISVGPSWTGFTPEQQQSLIEAFSKMTVATYANRFDGYAGEKFEVNPKVETRGNDRIVKTKLVPTADEPVTLNYLMRKSGEDWKVVDVYLSGTISELATRRSEFTAVIKTGGADALLANLKQRADELMTPAG